MAGYKRITNKDLEQQAELLNYITGNEEQPCHWTPEDGTIWHIGSFYIAGAYGGYKLLQVTNKGGGCIDALPTGYTTKKDLYNSMRCFERGLHVVQDKMEEKLINKQGGQ